MSRSGSAHANTDAISYTYNDRSELTGAASNMDTTYSYSYAYDPIGNRITANEAGVPWTYTTNSLNQYTSATENNTQLSFAYDLDGSMTYRPVDATSGWTQVWNGENRMAETTKGSDRLTFKYDYMGRRVEKSVFSNNTLASKTLFVYDGFKCVEELDALNSNAVAMRHTWQSIDVGLDVILSTTDGNGTTCFLHDANKNVMQRIDELNGLEDCLTYSPFGVNVNNCQLHFGFSCEVTESFICLDYFNYRYYAPNIGRWIRPDPFTEKGFSLFTQSDIFDNISFFDDNNLLIYAQNNGIMEYDNIGLACGSTYSDILIPDKPSGFDFTQPCIIHDDCYGCKGKNEGKTKSDCDKQFLRDMQAVCNTHPESKKAWCTRHRGRRVIRYRCTKHPRKECKNLAAIYHWAVDTFGKGAYDNARKCCP